MLANQLPPIIEINHALGSSLRIDMTPNRLYKLCLQHQTHKAERGCKEQDIKASATPYHSTLIKLNNILRSHQDSNNGTKKTCSLCWENGTSGNAANAAEVKKRSTVQVCTTASD